MYLELEKAYREAGYAEQIPPLRVMEFQDLAAFRKAKPHWYLSLNPNGKVPTFVDAERGVVMFESGAICMYLLDTFDTKRLLLPESPAARAAFYQLAFYCTGTVDNLTATSVPIQRGKLMTDSSAAPSPPYADPSNKVAWDGYVAAYFEAQLRASGGPFYNGKSFSASDVLLGYNMSALHEKMASVSGASWLDAERTPLLHSYARMMTTWPQKLLAYNTALAAWAEQRAVTISEAAVPTKPKRKRDD